MKAIALCDYEAYACDPYGEDDDNEVITVNIKKGQKWDVEIGFVRVKCTRKDVEILMNAGIAREVFGEKAVSR